MFYTESMKIHTTIGIYPNGSFKLNGVKDEHLEHHIEYNKTLRPGRALVVDNKIVYHGYLTEEQINKIIKDNDLESVLFGKSTEPYE